MNFRVLQEKSAEEREYDNKVLGLVVEIEIVLPHAKCTQK